MSTVGYEQDPTQLILSQLKLEQSRINKNLAKPLHSYFQVEYAQRHIFKMNPQEAQRYEKSPQQENIREYLEETKRDKQKQDSVKYDLKKNFFKIRHMKPLNIKEYTVEQEPIELIKSFSQPQGFLRKSMAMSSLKDPSIAHSQVTSPSRADQKSRYSMQFQQLLDESQKLAIKKSRFKLKGGTLIEKQKINEEIMRSQRKEILQIIKKRDYSSHRPEKLDQIPNKEKYSLGFVDYMKTKTKQGLDKSLFQKKIRKIDGRLEYFQQFILQEGRIKKQAKQRLENFYIKMREEFRRIERDHASNQH